jgi:NADH-quinone oxidoreductase subunit M
LEAQTLVWLILVVPLIGAALAALCGRGGAAAARWVSLVTVLINLALTIALACPAITSLAARPPAPTDAEALSFAPEHVTRIDLLPVGTDAKPAAIQFYVGIDGLNLWLIVLTAFLMVPSVLVSWTAITERGNEFYAWLLILETGMLGVFVSFDLILFYVFFELTLVPLFFLIGVWGGPLRRDAARKFFLFTLAGSVIALLGLIGIVIACKNQTGELTFAIPRLIELVQQQLRIEDATTRSYWHQVQMLVFLAMTAGFAVKVPLFPVHTWLPLAHVEAPTAGSVLLAGVLLKLGSYGFLRLAIPLCPDAALSIGVPLLGTLAAIGIIYGALCAFAQQDVKKMVAYSSVSHMGFCVLGLFALNSAGINGGLLQMINHGLSTGGLFLLVGMLYERYHTRMIPDYGGMAARLKLLSFFMVFICLTSVGFPGLNGFIGEMLILAGTYTMNVHGVSSRLLVFIIACGIFLGGWYLFTMLKNVFFGPLHEPHHEGHAVADLNGRELAAIVPVAIACIAMGLYPQPVLDSLCRDVNTVVKITDAARDRAAMTKNQ